MQPCSALILNKKMLDTENPLEHIETLTEIRTDEQGRQIKALLSLFIIILISQLLSLHR
jgi:hypothetical protein